MKMANFDIENNLDAVKYEIRIGVGSFSKGLLNSDKLYPKFVDSIIDDFR